MTFLIYIKIIRSTTPITLFIIHIISLTIINKVLIMIVKVKQKNTPPIKKRGIYI